MPMREPTVATVTAVNATFAGTVPSLDRPTDFAKYTNCAYLPLMLTLTKVG